MRCPLTWVLTYTDFPPTRLQELLDTKARSIEELQRFVLNYLVMHLATTSEPGLMQVFEALHFPLTTSKVPQFGELPITRIGIGISTTRPSDALMIESAELTGMDAFEEVVKVEDIAAAGRSLEGTPARDSRVSRRPSSSETPLKRRETHSTPGSKSSEPAAPILDPDTRTPIDVDATNIGKAPDDLRADRPLRVRQRRDDRSVCLYPSGIDESTDAAVPTWIDAECPTISKVNTMTAGPRDTRIKLWMANN